MSTTFQKISWSAASLAFAPCAYAATLSAEVNLPPLEENPYYRPYLAAWVEGADQANLGTLTVWYDIKLRDNMGKGWLRNLRTWWRKGGEELQLPADGISGATRAPGMHKLNFNAQNAVLEKLPAGSYSFTVEVAREKGGHEIVRIPFEWNGSATPAQEAQAQGNSELGQISIKIVP